jgi:hypothetical protein
MDQSGDTEGEFVVEWNPAAYSSDPIAVYLEVGKKRKLAGAHDWPGCFLAPM